MLFQKARITKKDDPMYGREIWVRVGPSTLQLVRDANHGYFNNLRRAKVYVTNILSPTYLPDDLNGGYCVLNSDSAELVCDFAEDVPDEEL